MAFKDKGFWTGEDCLNVFDEHGCFYYSSSGQLGVNETGLYPYENQLIDVPISFSELGINMSEDVPLQNLRGFLSAFNDKGFWTGEDCLNVFDEHGFFDRLFSGQLGVDEAELCPSENKLIDVPVSVSELGINMSQDVPLQNLRGFLSVPSMPAVGADGLTLKRKVSGESSEDESSVGSSVPFPREASKMDQLNSKKYAHVASTSGHPFHAPVDVRNRRLSLTFGEGVGNDVPTDQSSNKGGFKGISWDSYEEVMEALSLPISSYSLLYEQPSFQALQMPRKKKVHESNNNAIMIPTQAFKSSPKSTIKDMAVKRTSSKELLHGFPSNVKSLTGTGVFDEVLVRYVSPLGELPGIISGESYLCGCPSCNFSKALNAYEFERHAGSKTSHPNNHIHFENGKSMHEVVQELKAVPRSVLFDAIQTVTDSPINQKAFAAWKESFQGDNRSKLFLEMGNEGTIEM